jgi:hypothetical protein
MEKDIGNDKRACEQYFNFFPGGGVVEIPLLVTF